eukprot:CAMPEP_0119557612 /NCGR_PEP_ID=MMETSP1352-20130426/9234_1 /TAXON_ID=265584 /ORGANISM="Stauroneis constricta, Strain CCMP1120" /LENGTH=216 /DNA_ID=CAMNT_0007604749 /DNA_START=23 /DNA_END=673 /DNA_ORIENTATION=-
MFLRSFALTICVLLAASTDVSSAFSVASQHQCSAFGGSVLVTGSNVCNANNNNGLMMKKGKANVPPQMRGQFKKQQEMKEMRDQMIEASKAGPDGLPVFNLFVRTKRANMWYPCGSFKGDERSAALAKSYAEDGLLSGISKKQLDGGIAGSLASDLDRLIETACRAYPQLRKSRNDLEFGYKLDFEGLPEDKKKDVMPVEPKEQKGVLDGIRNIFS